MKHDGTDPLSRARASIASARALLVDWDGCLAVGNELAPGAGAFLRRYADRVAIVSNNTTDLPEDFLQILLRQGVHLPPDRIILAGREALRQAVEASPSGRALVLANARMAAFARSVGLEVGSPAAEVVVLLRDTDFNYEKLQRAADALTAGASLIVGNPDRTHPGPNGTRVPETGALLAALSATIDLDRIQYSVVGKPYPALFRSACAALRIDPSSAVMIGDNPDTDGVGARRLGMDVVLVGNEAGISLTALG